jgi:RND family efflux transporter MFP subunit
MKKPSIKQAGVAVLAIALGAGALLATAGARDTEPKGGDAQAAAKPDAKPKATLSVNAVQPQRSDWPTTVSANGSIAAWQEAVIGSELGGLRLAVVSADVGDKVRRGQVLARYTADSVGAELAQQEAAVEEASAALSEAQANANRGRVLATTGAISGQQIEQYNTAERSAKARLGLARARMKIDQIRLRQLDVVAPDDGVISARSASVGAVVQQGQELFKLIRQSRIEWRAEVPSGDLARIAPGQAVQVRTAGGIEVEGKVRMLSPAVDPRTRSAIVFVDLPVAGLARAGMFASGRFDLGNAAALTVPQAAVVTYDGYSYVFAIDRNAKVAQTKVALGRRVGERVEIVGGLPAGATVVGQGAGFLSDGDTVQVLAPAVPSLAQR